MKNVHIVLTVILGVALIASLIMWRKTQRDLQQQLHAVTEANNTLRGTLGELTVAITKKDREIDRLYGGCKEEEEQARPNFQSLPPQRNPRPSVSHKKPFST